MVIFIKKTLLFLVLTFVVIEGSAVFLIYTGLYLKDYSGFEVHDAILKSKKKDSRKKVLIGDSVGYQLFPNTRSEPSINSLAGNQAVSMVGQYILVKNYLEAGNKIDTLIGVFTPFSFKGNLDQVFTYHCFIKPFYRSKYMEEFTPTVHQQVEKIPFHRYAQIPHIYATTWAPKVKLEEVKPVNFLSPISKEYLNKLVELASIHNFHFKIIPAPTSENSRSKVNDLLGKESLESNLDKIFTDYFHDIIYLDSTLFYDGTHLKSPEIYSEKYRQANFNINRVN
jgi:hypothetical protein